MLEPFGDNLWTCHQPMRVMGLSELGHRMTVARLEDGTLWVHSPVAWSEELGAELAALGEPRWFFAPNLYHDTYWPGWFAAYPQGRFLGVPGFKRMHPGWPMAEVPGTAALPAAWGEDLETVPLAGMPRLNEWVCLHKPSQTLIVADLLMNFPDSEPDLRTRLLDILADTHGEPGPCRLFKIMVRDKGALRESFRRVLELDFENIIVGHGENVRGGGRAYLERAHAGYLGL